MLPAWKRHEPIVLATARALALRLPRSIAREDLAQVGRMALLAVAADAPLSYVRVRLRGAMLDFVRGEYPHAAIGPDAAALSVADHRAYAPHHSAALAMRGLAGREGAVMRLRYTEGLSQRAAGLRLGVSRDAVARSERSAIARLRKLHA